jgi:hypothetical protein
VREFYRVRGSGVTPLCASSEIEHVAVDFSAVDFRIVPLYTVPSLFSAKFIECLQQFFIAADIILPNEVINALIILHPKNNIPGLIIGPTVVGLISEAGLVSGSRQWFVCG